ncbi:MAG TPA: flavodoxin domain-containing protein [Myxococcales bacterium]|nr:flavodoxin domain-containing protein [Myxococcales bacterium]
MSRIAILFENSDDQVTRVAHRMAELLRARGHSVHASDFRSLNETFSLRAFDGAILGCEGHRLAYPRELRHYARRNVAQLERMPAWLFAVRADAGGGDPPDAARQLKKLEASTGWWPQRVLWLGGLHSYTEAGPVARLLMRVRAALHGWFTRVANRYAPTDWHAVRQFAGDFEAALPAPPPPPPLLAPEEAVTLISPAVRV